MKTKLIEFVSGFEGCRLEVYNDVSSNPTIGFGHLLPKDSTLTNIDLEQAKDLLWSDLQKAMHGVKKLISVPLNANQFIALVDFSFNCGLGTLQHSQVRMRINRGDLIGGADKMLVYCHAGARIIKGLQHRRLAEKQLFLSSS